ncbi:DUF72 domain-containing protein [Hansschlegelia plantiphila]|uniref:DUF72 domain-containing protein n=1 Tax=Hansschlegelia plantiphila TaxID=374655 RepID=UPI0022F2845F|nr:DUF72 domain-containing protein [Hansschlegelia plantiphila]
MATKIGDLFVGTAGWSVASRYADAVPGSGTHLERYARRLNATEIDTSFYRRHQHKTYERWAGATPDGFRFSVKLPRTITHERSLVDCGSLIDAFMADVVGLGGKLAVLLVQLPRSSPPDAAAAGVFFDQLRGASGAAVAFEPRHPGWFAPELDAWLAERRVARVAADPAPAPVAGEPGGWSGLRYYRWHGSPRVYYSDYDDAALVALRARADAGRALGEPTWCVFDNTASGAALGNALAFAGS